MYGAVLWLDADTGLEGGVWKDRSGYSHHAAAAVGNPDWVGGHFTLNGTNQYFVVEDHDHLDIGDGQSYAVVDYADPGNNTPRFIVAKTDNHDGASGTPGWMLWSTTGQARFSIKGGSSQQRINSQSMADPAGPTIIAGVRDAEAGSLGFCLGGAYDYTRSDQELAPLTSTSDVTIGAAIRNNGTVGYQWPGDIYGVAIFPRALTPTQIGQVAARLSN